MGGRVILELFFYGNFFFIGGRSWVQGPESRVQCTRSSPGLRCAQKMAWQVDKATQQIGKTTEQVDRMTQQGDKTIEQVGKMTQQIGKTTEQVDNRDDTTNQQDDRKSRQDHMSNRQDDRTSRQVGLISAISRVRSLILSEERRLDAWPVGLVCDVVAKLIIYPSPISLEVKLVSNFLIYLGQNCIKRSLIHPNDFRNSFFGTFPYIVKKILRYISVHSDM